MKYAIETYKDPAIISLHFDRALQPVFPNWSDPTATRHNAVKELISVEGISGLLSIGRYGMHLYVARIIPVEDTAARVVNLVATALGAHPVERVPLKA